MQNLNFKSIFLGIIIALVSLGVLFFAWKLTSKSTNPTASNIVLKSQDHIEGNSEASVTLIEYSDFQCPTCGLYYPLIKKIVEKYHDKLKFVYRSFPLKEKHVFAKKAAMSAEAAAVQGKFFEYHNQLFENQKAWSAAGEPDSLFLDYAKKINLDLEKFKKDQQDPKLSAWVDESYDSGIGLGVEGTPTFFLNGIKIDNPQSLEEFDKVIQDAISKNPLPSSTKSKKVHEHIDIRVVLNGKPFDFTKDKYQSTEKKELNKDIHMHDGNGEIIHKHKANVSLNDFFSSLGIKFNKNCFELDTGEKYCNNRKKSLNFFVNGKLNGEFENYKIEDLDRLLIIYADVTESQISKQIESVTDKACIYSEKCPERGKPPSEECVGGLGTGC